MTNILTKVINRYNYIMICGDFNVNVLRESHDKIMFEDFIDSFKLSCQNKEPTRVAIDKNGHISKSKIDYFLIHPPIQYQESVVDLQLGDHFGLDIKFDHIRIPENIDNHDKIHTFRDLSNSNLLNLSLKIKNEYFLEIFHYPNNIDQAFATFVNTLTYFMDLTCPMVTKKFKHSHFPVKWITNEIVKIRDDLKNLFWLSKNTCDPIILQNYKTQKKQYIKKVNETKMISFQCSLEDKTPQQKQKFIWKMVNTKTGKNNVSKNIQSIQTKDNIIQDKKYMANAFVEYFASCASIAVGKHFPNTTFTNYTTMYIQHTFHFIGVDRFEVSDIILALKTTNTVGVDCIPTKVIKHISSYIADPLAYLINQSVTLGKFPSDLKLGIVTPVFKKGNQFSLENYRPITVPTILCKVIEKSIYKHMLSFLHNFNILTKHQHGFLPDRSTESATTGFFNYIHSQLDRKRYVGALFFDLSKAFDCIDISIIENKLYALGFRGVFLSWLSSYLKTRKICVKVDNIWSEFRDVERGVPQGSVLGPLIFLLYVNDLPVHTEANYTVLYADDTTLAADGESPTELAYKLNRLAENFTLWCKKNSLILNSTKTVVMQFSSRNQLTSQFTVKVEREVICSSAVTKFLGVMLDSNLSWTSNIDTVCKKLNSAYYAILQLKNTLYPKQLLQVYYSLVYSHISYHIVLWGNSPNASRVFIMQKRIIRLIFNLDFQQTCREHFRNHKILTFPSIYIYKCILYAKNHFNEFPRNQDFHKYSTRHGKQFCIPKHSTTLYEHSPQYNGIKFFNHLPLSIKTLNNQNHFKRALKNFLIEKCVYTISTDYMC